MFYIGCHLSPSKGFKSMAETALKINANTIQFFLRNPRGASAKEIDKTDMDSFLKLIKQHKFSKVLAHAPYTLNPCAKDKKTREFAEMVFADDLRRMEYIPGNLYNFHPGCHVGQGIPLVINQIVDVLNTVMTKNMNTTVLLETMSGKGTEVGSTFEELAEIIFKAKLNDEDKLGVCLDTCHIYSAGYDIVNKLDEVLQQFDKIIGLNRLKAIHLNDSMTEFNSHKDRHEKIGYGSIGLEAIIRFINHPLLKGIPLNLETPNELDGYAGEIAILRQSYQES